uniref:Pyr_redox_2 domain-containing protein n=1 Tax=Rhabditophanes sp. KR3021 TaxID=114890 RepID=A0AC35U9Y7_9BILA
MKLTKSLFSTEHFKVLILGGGAGGCAIASHLVKTIPKSALAIIEPSQTHYYQPGFTLIGSGLFPLDKFKRDQSSIIPKNTTWIKDSVGKIIPSKNRVITENGKEISYEFLVIATGVEPRFDLIEGLQESLDDKDSNVVSIYSPKYVERVFERMKLVKSGNALFTFPNGKIKCAGAPLKICLLFESYHHRNKDILTFYNTPMEKIFGVEKYAKQLMHEVNARQNLTFNPKRNLIKVDPLTQKAVFQCAEEGKTSSFETDFSFLHVGPPCTPVKALRTSEELGDKDGWISVDQYTLQSNKFENIFGLGDCITAPNAKTAAAVSSQFKTVKQNLDAVMNGKKPTASYDGYGSCPLVVSPDKVILAEFNYDGPIETTPFDQSKPSRLAYLAKAHLMPPLYWHGLVKGRWNGPETIRKVLHLGLTK